MSGGRRRRGFVAAVVLGCCVVSALGGTSAVADPLDVAGEGMDVGAAAATGAASAVTMLLGDSAERAAQAAATVATSALPPPKTPPIPKTTPGGWRGWVSGASGAEAESGMFAGFRGEPLGIVAVWSDTSVEAQTDMDSVDNYAGFTGQMDVAVGALVRGETWEQAASGAFVDRWTTAIRNIKAKRAGKGTTYIRIAHEFNGDWMAWGVNASNVAAYKQGYRLYASIVRKEFPQAKLTWSPNGGNHNTLTTDQMYPGSDVVDVIGPDDYDGYPNYTSASLWKENVNAWTTPSTPKGLGAWAQYAARKGKPLAVPEWGMQGGDHPAYIQGVHDFLVSHAAKKGSRSVAGKVVYDAYFNAEDKFKLTSGTTPQASQLYAALSWGN